MSHRKAAPLDRSRDGDSALHVLFVCTGNICRSPVAERLAVEYARRNGLTDFSAGSAGTRAVHAQSIHPYSARFLEQRGADAQGFTARQLTISIASGADLILTMTREHRDQVLELAPRKLRNTFTLAEAALLTERYGAQGIPDLPGLRPHLRADDVPDVLDPIGQTPEFFDAIGAEIEDLLPPVLELCRPR